MKKRKENSSTRTNEKSGSGMDDALTLETGSGNNTVTHGLMVDTFARSVPTGIIPFYVRDTIFRAWHGMNGRRVDYTAPTLPWYAYDGFDGTTDSVAHRLAVTVQDAEQWGIGNQTNAFGMYADMPLNPATMARWSFWRYDPLASELDPSMALEPQAYALDAFSQLFGESAMFHFGFLADVDKEYHRLRGIGPLGRLDEQSSEYEAWYHVYHYWRNQLDVAYLQGSDPLVVLPQHLYDANWTIADVLAELYAMMTTTGGELLPDIIITGKGLSRAANSITLGVQEDPAYHDADGNVRFYFPYMENLTDVISVSSPVNGMMMRVPTPFSDTGQDMTGFNGRTTSEVKTSITAAPIRVNGIWEMYAADTHALNTEESWYGHMRSAHEALPATGTRPVGLIPDIATADLDNTGQVLSDFMTIRSLPTTGYMDGHHYWSGHTLNFVEMIKFAQEIGRAIEPEVLNTLIYPMGVVGDAGTFVRRPAGATARHVDELYNLYESGFSFNENPARLYTAAHLGPTNHVLEAGDLNLAGVPLESRIGTRYVSVRERYWTPTAVDNADATLIAASFFPNTRLDVTLYRNLDVQGLAAYDEERLRAFVSRTLGNVTSMRTKVEKPIYLPAGKSGPETVYASGVGAGATQLVVEMVMALAGGAPRFGLGHAGWTDISTDGSFADGDGEFVNRAEANEAINNSLLYTPFTADVDSHWWDQLSMTGLVGTGFYAPAGYDSNHPWVPSLGSQAPYALSQMGIGGLHSPTLALFNMGGNSGYPDVYPFVGWTDLESRLLVGSHPRAVFGTEKTPFHSVITSTMGGSRYWSYGARLRTGSGSNQVIKVVDDALVSSGSSVSQDDVSEYTLFIVPEMVRFTLGDRTYNVNIADPSELFENNGAGGVTIQPSDRTMTFSLWDGWINFNDGSTDWGTNTNSSSAWRGVTSNGTWSANYLRELAGGSFATSANYAANIRRMVPNKTLSEVCQAAFQLGSVLYGESEAWSNDVADYSVDVTVNEYYGLSQPYSGQTQKAVGSFSAGTAGPVTGDGGSPLPYFASTVFHLNPRGATSEELTDTIRGIEVSAPFESAGLSPLEAQLTPLHQAGTTWEYIGTDSIQNEGLRLPYSSGSAMQTIATTVFGVDGRSQWAMMGGRWGDVSVSMDGTDDHFSQTPEWGSPYTTSPMNVPSTNGNWFTSFPMGRTCYPEAGGVGANFAAYFGLPGNRIYNTYGQGNTWGYSKLSSHSAVSIATWASQRLDTEVTYRSVAVDDLGAQLTFVYPDDPKYKMMYRPWRRIADASIMKELRRIFANDGEDVSFSAGALGIKTIGTTGQFRFAELLDAGQPETFILEQATSKTRLTSPSYRSVLTFTKQSLLDPAEQRHTIPDAVDELNQGVLALGVGHKSGVGGEVLTRQTIRDLQLGRQYQSM